MKVLHAAETIRGGVATVIRHNARAQVKEWGEENILVLVPDSQVEDMNDARPVTIHTFHRTGRNIPSFVSFLRSFVNIILSERPDIVHLHSTFSGFLGRLALLPLRIINIRPKVVYCPHAWAFLMEGSQMKKKIYAVIEKILLHATDLVICVSKYEKQEAEKFGIISDKIKVVYNGVPVPSEISQKEKSDITQILFVGRLDYQKGFDIALDVMKALEGKPYFLNVVGDFVHAGESYQERSNISYKGWISPDEVSEYFKGADFLVLPSRWEGFAMCPLEAMSFATPVLASDTCSLPEIVIDGVSGRLAKVGDVKKLTEIIETTTQNQWHDMGLKAREYVQSHFTVKKMAGETISLYRFFGNHHTYV